MKQLLTFKVTQDDFFVTNLLKNSKNKQICFLPVN